MRHKIDTTKMKEDEEEEDRFYDDTSISDSDLDILVNDVFPKYDNLKEKDITSFREIVDEYFYESEYKTMTENREYVKLLRAKISSLEKEENRATSVYNYIHYHSLFGTERQCTDILPSPFKTDLSFLDNREYDISVKDFYTVCRQLEVIGLDKVENYEWGWTCVRDIVCETAKRYLRDRGVFYRAGLTGNSRMEKSKRGFIINIISGGLFRLKIFHGMNLVYYREAHSSYFSPKHGYIEDGRWDLETKLERGIEYVKERDKEVDKSGGSR